jgi:hypothetical protein
MPIEMHFQVIFLVKASEAPGLTDYARTKLRQGAVSTCSQTTRVKNNINFQSHGTDCVVAEHAPVTMGCWELAEGDLQFGETPQECTIIIIKLPN